MEGFFYISCQVDEVRLKDLLLRRYHQLDFVKDLSLMDFLELVKLAMEEEQKEKHRQEWLHLLPLMITSGKYMSFDEYFDKVSGRNIDMRSTEEIIAEIDAAHAKVEKHGT